MFTSRDLGQFLYSLFNVLEVIGIVAAIVIAIIASTARVHSIRDLVWESKYLQLYRAGMGFR